MLGRIGNLTLTARVFKSGPQFISTRRSGFEHFIPFRPTELIECLAQRSELSLAQASTLRTVAKRMQIRFHFESTFLLNRLQELYSGNDPDADTESLSPAQEKDIKAFIESLTELLNRANFRRLEQAEIEKAVGNASELGVQLDLDLDRFAYLAVFARGLSEVTYAKREWKKGWLRQVDFSIPMYQRIVGLYILKSEDDAADKSTDETTYLRLFKNVPVNDIDMVLPGGKVRMSLLDHGKILFPSVSGVSLAVFKIGLLFFAGIYGLIKILGLLGGALGSSWKSIAGYRKTKNKYELSLTRNLYYQNLDNNFGVLLRLANEAEKQELREALVGYFVLLLAGEPCSVEELDARAETLILELGAEVDFEVKDALQKLIRLGLCEPDAGGGYRVVKGVLG